MIASGPGAAQPAAELGRLLVAAWAQAAAACARSGELQQQASQVRAGARAARRASEQARRRRRSSPAGRDLLQRSEYARLLARLKTMPVIEQAKGIIMAQSRCGTRKRSACCAGRPSGATCRCETWPPSSWPRPRRPRPGPVCGV